MQNPQMGWSDVRTIELEGLKVTLSEPVLVSRSKGYLWFPTLIRRGKDEILAMMSTMPDVDTDKLTSAFVWSRDQGLTWDQPRHGVYSGCTICMANGDLLLLPFHLFPRTDGMGAVCQTVVKDTFEIRAMDDGIIVTGWSRPDRSRDSELGLAGFVFNGQAVELRDGSHLATLYGRFRGAERYSLVAAESTDGRHWRIRSIIADESCGLQGKEGPCESAMCRLKDGRLMCVFRMSSGIPYGQCWSGDEGRNWTAPVAMTEAHSVQPSLAVMKRRTVVLCGGRPGIFAWINADGTGADWQMIDVQAHHNMFCPGEPIVQSSCYTEVVVLDDTHVLMVYDRIPHGWDAIPEDSPDSNSVWVLRIGVAHEK